MDLFEIVDDKRVAPTAQALMIHPFKDIWEKNEEGIAILKFTYIEFMCSYKKTNPYIGYKEEERPYKILDTCFPNGTEEERGEIMEDELVLEGMKFYEEVQSQASPSLRLYEASLTAADKMVEFFTTFDLSSRNPKTGALQYKPVDLTRALKDTADVVKTLTSLKGKVTQELYEDSKGKAGREINHFEKAKSER